MNVIAQIFLLALLLAFFVGVPVLAYVVIGHWFAPVRNVGHHHQGQQPVKIADIIHEAHATACEKGWHERPLRNEAGELDVDRVAAKLALIHSEITEAWECWAARDFATRVTTSGKPEGLFVELADVVIRVGDLLGALGIEYAGSWTTTYEVWDEVIRPSFDDMPARFMRAHTSVSYALEALRDSSEADVEEALTCLIGQCVQLAKGATSLFVGASPDSPDPFTEAVRIKTAYNRTRPHRHGGKAL